MAAPVLSSETPLEPLKNESLIHATPTGGIVLKYEIESTVEFIQQNKSAHRIIALQFPDELLSDSVPVFQALKTRLGDGHELYILADTTFGR